MKISLNAFLVETLEINLVGERAPVEYDDMDDLAGTWVVALAVQHDLFLCYRGSHFRHLPQIPVM